MPNINQNNEIESINKEISLLQDRLDINEKSLNQFKIGLRRIGRLRLKQGQKINLSKTKKMQEALKDIFKNKIKLIKKRVDILKNALVKVKKRKRLSEKGLKKIAKMQNLSQNEFNQIAEMRGLSRDELEQIAKIRRIKNYEDMKKEDLIISLLKSKESTAELFNDNRLDNEISDIRRIINRLRDILPKKVRKEIKDKLYKIEHQINISEEEQEENGKYLRKIVRFLNNKEEFSLNDHDDIDYYGIRDIENLFHVSEENYYKPIFVKSSHKDNYKHESNGDIKKELSVN